jgi:predicted HTH transcriptional regulator
MLSDFELRQLLSLVKVTPSQELESETIEFKEYAAEQALLNAKDIAQEISALANRNGGDLIVGVRDSSNVPYGQWNEQLIGAPSCDLLEVRERTKGRVKPQLDISVRKLAFEGLSYLVIGVPRRRDSLVTTTSGKVYVRDGRSSRPMEPHEIEAAVKSLQKYDWSSEDLDLNPEEVLDERSVREAQLDFQQRRAIPEDVSLKAFLESIGAAKNGLLTKAGLLFLGHSWAIQRHLGDFEHRFTWKTRGGALPANDVWSGNIWSSVQRAKNHFQACNVTRSFSYKGREFPVPALDPVAFHEAYLNALVHRDYSSDGMISVTYSSGRMVISSPGGFYGGVTPDNIVIHEPRHRNKALARVLMLFNLVDRAGMGVLRMGVRSLIYGRSFPEFAESFGSVEVSMQGEFLRAGIFVLTADHPDRFDLVDLVLLNDIFKGGFVSVEKMEAQIRNLVPDPWRGIQGSVERHPFFELCGDRRGVYVRVSRDYRELMEVSKQFRASSASAKFVRLFEFLKQHAVASNADITELLGHRHSSQTSKFLRDTLFVKRSGTGPAARWSFARNGT